MNTMTTINNFKTINDPWTQFLRWYLFICSCLSWILLDLIVASITSFIILLCSVCISTFLNSKSFIMTNNECSLNQTETHEFISKLYRHFDQRKSVNMMKYIWNVYEIDVIPTTSFFDYLSDIFGKIRQQWYVFFIFR